MNKISNLTYTAMYMVAFVALAASHYHNPAAYEWNKCICYAFAFMFYVMLYAGALEKNERPLFGVTGAGYLLVLAVLLMFGVSLWLLPAVCTIVLLTASILVAYITGESMYERQLLHNAVIITVLTYLVWYIILH